MNISNEERKRVMALWVLLKTLTWSYMLTSVPCRIRSHSQSFITGRSCSARQKLGLNIRLGFGSLGSLGKSEYLWLCVQRLVIFGHRARKKATWRTFNIVNQQVICYVSLLAVKTETSLSPLLEGERERPCESGFDGDSCEKRGGTPGVTSEMPASLPLLLRDRESPETKAPYPRLCLLTVAGAGVETLGRDGTQCSVSERWSEARSFRMDSESDCGRMLPVCCIGKLTALEVYPSV
ncbi:uncharacterized protein [Mobula birostris]|uniref:uncharacterized protein n=1 Tax=Mobula birostris TaxID=1983395 RepID=UPI003B27EE0F